MEKERPLDAAVFLRFAACGAACGSSAHAFLIPIDVVKTRMQSEPQKYPDMLSTFQTLVEEEVRWRFPRFFLACFVGLFVGQSLGRVSISFRRFGVP